MPSLAIRSIVDPFATAPLVAELERRRNTLVDSLEGVVLSLTGPPALLTPDAVSKVDHVVCVGWLGAAEDLDAAIATVMQRLRSNGWVHVIEPTRGSGSLSRAQQAAATAALARTGWYLGRDLPAALRRNHLVLTDLERFSMPVSSTVLRPWVQGRARRPAGGAS